MGRLLQLEERGKQAGWSRSVQNRKIAPREKKRKKNMVETRKKHMYNRVT